MIYRKEIDGLRAIAVVSVILFHAGLVGFDGGFVGVDVFFVISGYLITSIILTEIKNDRFSYIEFYERRARRILPALFLVVFTCIPVAWLWMLPVEFKDFTQSVTAVSIFSSNILFWTEGGYFSENVNLKPLLHTWSLAVEEQYYIIFPVLIVICWKFSRQWLVIISFTILLLSFSITQFGGNFQLVEPYIRSDFLWFFQPNLASFYLITGRAWELMIGSLIALFLGSGQTLNLPIVRHLDVVGLAMIVFSVITFNKSLPFPSVYTLVPTLGTALIILFSSENSITRKILSMPIFVGIGLVSYSAYLWHQPLFAMMRIRNLNEPGTWVFIGLTLLAFLLAYFSWRYIECPARDKHRMSRNKFIGSMVLISVVMFGFGLVGQITDGYKFRVSEDVLTLVNYSKDMNPRREECLSGIGYYIKPEMACVTNSQAQPTIALYADSHGDTLADSLAVSLNHKKLNMQQLTYKGCAPVKGLYVVGQSGYRKCEEYSTDVYDYLTRKRNISHVILSARWALYLEGNRFDNKEGGREKEGRFIVAPVDDVKWRFSRSERQRLISLKIIESVNSLLKLGKRVILVYPIPEVGWDVPKYLAKSEMWGIDRGEGLSTSYGRFKERNIAANTALDSIENHPNLIRIKPAEIFCNNYIKNRCIAELNGKPLYYDNNHLNSIGAKLVVDKIMESLI